MKIRRTYKDKSRKAGQSVIVDESVAREVFGQTSVAHHGKGECERHLCNYCSVPAMRRLLAGAKVETYFSEWQLAES